MALKAGRVGVNKNDVDPKTGKIKEQGTTYELPIASPSTLGGVKPVAKTEGMTQGVGVDSSGGLYTTPPQVYTLPVADSETLGGVKPVAKTSGMTQNVGVDSSGGLFTEPAAGGVQIYYKDYTIQEGWSYVEDTQANYIAIGCVGYSQYSGYASNSYTQLFYSNFNNGFFRVTGSGDFLSHGAKVRVFFVAKNDLISL